MLGLESRNDKSMSVRSFRIFKGSHGSRLASISHVILPIHSLLENEYDFIDIEGKELQIPKVFGFRTLT